MRIIFSQNLSKLNSIPGLSASSSKPTTEHRASCMAACSCSASSSDMEHCPSVINRMSAFSNASSFISRNASRIGGSKSVPPSKKCSAAESRSSAVYCPGRNRSVRNASFPEKWISANFRPSCAQMSCTARASALPHAAFSPSVEADSSRQTMISPCPLWTRSRLAYCSSPFALYLRRNSGVVAGEASSASSPESRFFRSRPRVMEYFSPRPCASSSAYPSCRGWYQP
mgnify:CR=1 FL=1